MSKQKNALKMVYTFLEKVSSNEIIVSEKQDVTNGLHTVDTFCEVIQNKVDYAKLDDLIVTGDYTKEQLGCLHHLKRIEKLLGHLKKQPKLFEYFLFLLNEEAQKGLAILD